MLHLFINVKGINHMSTRVECATMLNLKWICSLGRMGTIIAQAALALTFLGMTLAPTERTGKPWWGFSLTSIKKQEI